MNISSLCNFRSRWSLCLVSCAVASVMSGEDPPILTIRADKQSYHVQNLTSYIEHLTSNGQHLTSDVLQVPCKPDMLVGDVLSMLDLKKNVVLVSRHQTNGKIIIYHNKIHIYVFLFFEYDVKLKLIKKSKEIYINHSRSLNCLRSLKKKLCKF